ncbi:guanine nucleotide exchange factor in Golgi transport N-terminal-domain-containing protein [Suillus clintonianus]|uniref:guanine nucleotide exchange factor in Golgi transport N-terminal-domain-containing protein n=1 Tax=Suillus clintonianus TaxID=1904413 RepID=UPI001B85CD15|nr:guanine nucleotide exchange factor in Golgi transport N-terminal-domain-containing protein [Suillus clintonianus]KAG2149149.1 guanine nucleotide exchange factor in Golgi transport N-terminal-domain-containing protein [Suillus clintonianus]
MSFSNPPAVTGPRPPRSSSVADHKNESIRPATAATPGLAATSSQPHAAPSLAHKTNSSPPKIASAYGSLPSGYPTPTTSQTHLVSGTHDTTPPLNSFSNSPYDPPYQQWDSGGRAVGYAPDPRIHAPQHKKPESPFPSDLTPTLGTNFLRQESTDTAGWELQANAVQGQSYRLSAIAPEPLRNPYGGDGEMDSESIVPSYPPPAAPPPGAGYVFSAPGHSFAGGSSPPLPGTISPAPPAMPEVAENGHAARELSTQDMFIKDVFLVFRALCKFTMKPLNTDRRDDTDSQHSERDLKPHAMRSKLLSLHLVLIILNSHTALFVDSNTIIYSSSTNEAATFVQGVNQYLCLSLSHDAATPVPQVFEVNVEIFGRVLSGMRMKLKKNTMTPYPSLDRLIASAASTEALQQSTPDTADDPSRFESAEQKQD